MHMYASGFLLLSKFVVHFPNNVPARPKAFVFAFTNPKVAASNEHNTTHSFIRFLLFENANEERKECVVFSGLAMRYSLANNRRTCYDVLAKARAFARQTKKRDASIMAFRYSLVIRILLFHSILALTITRRRRRRITMISRSATTQRKRKGLSEHFLEYSDGQTSIFFTAIGWRLLIWGAMSLSCAMIPNHNPGHDVLQFPLAGPNMIRDERHERMIEWESCPSPFSYPESISNKSITQTVSFPVFILQSKIYPFLLKPLTRWDAARFLRLAYQPHPRRPSVECNDDETKNEECLFSDSEQTHAFFPLFPFMIQVTALVLSRFLPRFLLPATCPSLLVFSAVCLNMTCFLLVTFDLYSMTRNILLFHSSQIQEKKRKEEIKPILTSRDCEMWARRVALLFVFNPANVFFGTAYSEAMSAALLFHGCRWALDMVLRNAASGQTSVVRSTWLTMLGTTGFWWMAALTRSNSTLYGGFLLLYGAGLVFRTRCGTWVWRGHLFAACYVVLLVTSLAYGSIGWHNFRGYSIHCVEFVGIRPAWCEQGLWFNLYGHVQRKYWNVGFLRYFQLKQIPNFLLASPVLMLSTVATITWIRMNWKLLNDGTKALPHRVALWSVTALQIFAGEKCQAIPLSTPGEILQGSPYLLGFYAVLAASTLLGFTMAHVQISTRLICSSCPALYWFLAGALTKKNKQFGDAIIGFFLVYNILGVAMHPNWLPWT